MNDTTNLNSGSDDEVQFIASVKTTTPKTGRFILSEDAVKIIESGNWLTDHIIGAAHSVLETNSLTSVEWKIQLWVQSTISLYKGESSPKCSVLEVVTGYWLRTSDAPVHLRFARMTAFCRGRIQLAVKQQIASIIYEEGTESFKIVVPKVQRQNNYHDCGVFAIAFLVSLLHGVNPSDLTFDNGEMKKHLIKSLKGAFFQPFPLSQVQEQRTQEQVFVQDVPVICDCRMPWDKSAGKSPSMWCAQCNICKEWYHRKCVPFIPHMIFKGSNATWRCPKCQTALKEEENKRPSI